MEGLAGETKIRVQTGPAINGTDLRDATGEIRLGDFKNQIECQHAGAAINDAMKAAASSAAAAPSPSCPPPSIVADSTYCDARITCPERVVPARHPPPRPPRKQRACMTPRGQRSSRPSAIRSAISAPTRMSSSAPKACRRTRPTRSISTKLGVPRRP